MTKRKRNPIQCGVFMMLACALLIGVYIGLMRWKCIPVPSKVLSVQEVSLLSDGRIIYHLDVKDDKEIYFTRFFTLPDGSYYITPMRSVFERPRTDKSGLRYDYFLVDIAVSNAYQARFGKGITIKSCYLGSKKDAILLWSEGMELPQASEVLETLCAANHFE